jgi:hypothetical protein
MSPCETKNDKFKAASPPRRPRVGRHGRLPSRPPPPPLPSSPSPRRRRSRPPVNRAVRKDGDGVAHFPLFSSLGGRGRHGRRETSPAGLGTAADVGGQIRATNARIRRRHRQIHCRMALWRPAAGGSGVSASAASAPGEAAGARWSGHRPRRRGQTAAVRRDGGGSARCPAVGEAAPCAASRAPLVGGTAPWRRCSVPGAAPWWCGGRQPCCSRGGTAVVRASSVTVAGGGCSAAAGSCCRLRQWEPRETAAVVAAAGVLAGPASSGGGDGDSEAKLRRLTVVCCVGDVSSAGVAAWAVLAS